ncbi:MAG: hypothetical protein KJ574_01540 [Nanoarchaeota archaeon]|nr:hypothetical protein [Nanoarchaeota archaeon]
MKPKPQYLVSKGIVNLLLNRYKLDLSDMAQRRLSSLETEFTQRLGEELADTFAYEVVSAEDIDITMHRSLQRINGLPVINLDDIYFQALSADATISITRLVDDVNAFDKKILGPRKGACSLDDQIDELATKFRDRDVALMDVGVFAGETLLDEERGIVALLEKKGVRPRRLYVSIMNIPSLQHFNEKGIDVVTSNKLYDFTDGDWLEVRDLLGLDGRKINAEKYRVNGSTHLFARYIQDPHTLKVGAGIADGVTAAIVLDLCNMYQKKILREIRRGGYQVIEGSINSDPRLYTLEFRKSRRKMTGKNAR